MVKTTFIHVKRMKVEKNQVEGFGQRFCSSGRALKVSKGTPRLGWTRKKFRIFKYRVYKLENWKRRKVYTIANVSTKFEVRTRLNRRDLA